MDGIIGFPGDVAVFIRENELMIALLILAVVGVAFVRNLDGTTGICDDPEAGSSGDSDGGGDGD